MLWNPQEHLISDNRSRVCGLFEAATFAQQDILLHKVIAGTMHIGRLHTEFAKFYKFYRSSTVLHRCPTCFMLVC